MRRAAEERAARAAAAAGRGPSASRPRCRRRCASRPTRPSSGRGARVRARRGRLAFCGGFDLDDPRSSPRRRPPPASRSTDCLHAARDSARDGAIEAAGRRLLAAGADRLPALRVGRALFWGEDRVGDAAPARGRVVQAAAKVRPGLARCARALRRRRPGSVRGVAPSAGAVAALGGWPRGRVSRRADRGRRGSARRTRRPSRAEFLGLGRAAGRVSSCRGPR